MEEATMGKVTIKGLIPPDDPRHREQSIVIGRPWRTTAEDLARKKAKAKKPEPDEEK